MLINRRGNSNRKFRDYGCLYGDASSIALFYNLLAKNLGVDCVKPDRHLVRIAKMYNTNPFDMCQKLSDLTGDSLNTVDTVIWRAANLRMI